MVVAKKGLFPCQFDLALTWLLRRNIGVAVGNIIALGGVVYILDKYI